MKKVTDILLTVFAVGVLLALFVGGLTLLGYLAALAIGGETAAAICVFIFKTLFPWIIKFTSIFTGIGLVGMYLSKQTALSVKRSKK